MLYIKLALSNIKKSARDFSVYFITLVLATALFYSFNTMEAQSHLFNEQTANILLALNNVFFYLTLILSFIIGFLMVYANNYLLRRRNKEFGLYQVLGMTQKKVLSVLLYETLVTGFVSMIVGLALGIFASQFMVFITASVLDQPLEKFQFVFSFDALFLTVFVEMLVFAVMAAVNTITLKRMQLIDLMSSSRKNGSFGIKHPGILLVLNVSSIALIGYSYYRLAQHGYSVLFGMGESYKFGITTLVMIVGTFLFFWTISALIITLAQSFKTIYWKGLTLFSLRQMSSQALRGWVSEGVVALLLFFVICFVTSGYAIIESTARNNTPYTGSILLAPQQDPNLVDTEENDEVQTNIRTIRFTTVDELIKSYTINPQTMLKGYVAERIYKQIGGMTENITLKDLGKSAGISAESYLKEDDEFKRTVLDIIVEFLPYSDYVKTCTILGIEPVSLTNNQFTIIGESSPKLVPYYSDILKSNKPITFGATTLYPNGQTVNPSQKIVINPLNTFQTAYVIVPDSAIGQQSRIDDVIVNVLATPEQEHEVDTLLQGKRVQDEDEAKTRKEVTIGSEKFDTLIFEVTPKS